MPSEIEKKYCWNEKVISVACETRVSVTREGWTCRNSLQLDSHAPQMCRFVRSYKRCARSWRDPVEWERYWKPLLGLASCNSPWLDSQIHFQDSGLSIWLRMHEDAHQYVVKQTRLRMSICRQLWEESGVPRPRCRCLCWSIALECLIHPGRQQWSRDSAKAPWFRALSSSGQLRGGTARQELPKWPAELYSDRSSIRNCPTKECLEEDLTILYSTTMEEILTRIVPVTVACMWCNAVLVFSKIVCGEENRFPAVLNVFPIAPEIASFLEYLIVWLKSICFWLKLFLTFCRMLTFIGGLR